MREFDWIKDVIPPMLNGGRWVIDLAGLSSEQKKDIQEIVINKGWGWNSMSERKAAMKVRDRLCGSMVDAYYLNENEFGGKRLAWGPSVNPNAGYEYTHGSIVLESYPLSKNIT